MVAVAQHRRGFLTGDLYGILRNRRAQDVVKPGNSFDLFLRRGVGNDDRIVLVLSRQRQSFRMKCSHDLAGKAADANDFPNRVLHSKQLIAHCAADHADICGAVDIVLREDGALIHIPSLDVEIFRRHSAIRGMPVLVPVHDLHRIVYVRRNALDERDLVLDGNGIRHHQCFCIVRARAHAVHGTASCFNPDKIIPEIVQLLLDAGLSRLADGHDANDGRNPYRDSQDSQDAPHLISEQRNESGL